MGWMRGWFDERATCCSPKLRILRSSGTCPLCSSSTDGISSKGTTRTCIAAASFLGMNAIIPSASVKPVHCTSCSGASASNERFVSDRFGSRPSLMSWNTLRMFPSSHLQTPLILGSGALALEKVAPMRNRTCPGRVRLRRRLQVSSTAASAMMRGSAFVRPRDTPVYRYCARRGQGECLTSLDQRCAQRLTQS